MEGVRENFTCISKHGILSSTLEWYIERGHLFTLSLKEKYKSKLACWIIKTHAEFLFVFKCFEVTIF